MDKMNKQRCVWFSTISILLIINAFCINRCSHKYDVYCENYRDTIYVEAPKPAHKKYNMYGIPAGIVQEIYCRNGKRYVEIRTIDASELKKIEIGKHDYDVLHRGDTILGTIIIPHDTIYIYDTIRVEYNKNKKYNAFVFNGAPSGVIVEFWHQTQTIDGSEIEVPKSNHIVIRKFNDSKLEDFNIGQFDYDRLNKGDTIYGN